LDGEDVYRLGWRGGVGGFTNARVSGAPVVVDAVPATTELWVQDRDVRGGVSGGVEAKAPLYSSSVSSFGIVVSGCSTQCTTLAPASIDATESTYMRSGSIAPSSPAPPPASAETLRPHPIVREREIFSDK
jgi:hypothetical protein